MKKSVLNYILGFHTEYKEKALLMIDFEKVFSNTGIISKLQDIIRFFHEHIPVHFKYEEIAMDVFRQGSVLAANEEQLITRILNEHQLIRKQFTLLNDLSENIKNGRQEMKGQLAELIKDTFKMLFDHAELEEVSLFPLLDAKLTEEQLRIIQKEMSQIAV